MFQKQLETRGATIVQLRDELTELRKQRDAASEALKSSTIPEVAEFERLRSELKDAQEAKEKAERQFNSQQNQFDYAPGQITIDVAQATGKKVR